MLYTGGCVAKWLELGLQKLSNSLLTGHLSKMDKGHFCNHQTTIRNCVM